MFGQPVFWRETMKPAKFLIFDGRVVLVLVPAFMHLRVWTLIIAIAVMFTFWWFERKGISADSILRFIRAKFVGRRRTARGIFEERTAIDFGFECEGYLKRALSDAAIQKMKEAGQSKGFLARMGLSGKKKPATPIGTKINNSLAKDQTDV